MTTGNRHLRIGGPTIGANVAMAVEWIAVALATAAVALSLAGPAAASKSAPFGTEPYYAGARWDLVPTPAIGASATLRMDAGLAGDRRSGGHVAQLLWVNTNNPVSKQQRQNSFAGTAAVPYITAGISENRAGAPKPAVFVAQRNIRGEYYETYAPRSVRRSEDVTVAIQCTTKRGCDSKYDKGGNNGWQVFISGLGKYLNINNAGPHAGSSAMYAGLASTSAASAVSGRVSNLGWIAGGLINFPHPSGWFLNKKKFIPIIAATGPARARWDSQFVSLSNSMNRG